MDRNAKATNKPDNERDFRFIIAKIVLPISMGGVLALAIALAVTALARNDSDTATWVLAAVLPVLGTWVGTILAYYFAKENFESASRSFTETAERLTAMERLKAVMVKEKYIAKKDMVSISITKDHPESSVKLVAEILTLLEGKKRNRLPILDENDHCIYIIHRSMVDKYLTKKVTKDKLTTEDINELTLKNLLDDDTELKTLFENSFAIVAEEASMADAKMAMDRIPNCLDVFVTKNGKRDEPVIGWITNLIITECAKL